MPRPKYTSEGVRPRASRQFTDREEFIGAFEKAASELPLEEHKVLVYYGVGGIGKTRLRKELCRRLEERRPEVGWAVLDFGEMVLGSEHPETAISLNNLAKLLREQGRYGEAQPLLERALKIHENVLGRKHPDTARTRRALEDCLARRGK
jgi:tetratricopeptide (TPR) repeat protein